MEWQRLFDLSDKRMTVAISPKRIFLIDGIGAFVSAIMLGIVLIRYNDFIGMPKNVLYILAGLAGIFALYSFTNYFQLRRNWKQYLKGIAIANFLYCCLTLGCVLYYWRLLTGLGLLYFILEMIVISLLVVLELKNIQLH